MVGSSFFVSPVTEMTSEVHSTSFPAGPVPSLENSRQSGKRKAKNDSIEKAFRTPVPPPTERINIEFRRDELDPIALGKLPAPTAIATASVHKYWTYAFGKAADNPKLTELLKLAEMYISRSHMLNCELYKVLAMKVDELRSVVGRDEDIDALRSDNKDLREQLAFYEDARARAIYDITKAKTIQRECVQAQKKAESQLRSCQNMVHAKDKELSEALNELSRAQYLLAKLGVPGYANPKVVFEVEFILQHREFVVYRYKWFEWNTLSSVDIIRLPIMIFIARSEVFKWHVGVWWICDSKALPLNRGIPGGLQSNITRITAAENGMRKMLENCPPLSTQKNLQQQQPMVYNINKNDFCNVV
ncbi:hypothetical protein Fot_35144 [Forsythia ovata]|uniref:Uncharacterized protein n=1 Tax=Forsythia ovata TaxID=205694 RepID=A0ABD1SKR1_9LAMI